jgi:CBS domain-containing protein
MSVGSFCVRHVVTVSPATTVEEAARRMAEANVGALIVVEEGKPAGIVTDRDLVVRAIAERQPPAQTAVSTVMTPNPICITETAALEGAAERMKTYKLRRLVVLNTAQEVVGIITLDDLLTLLAEERQALNAVIGVMRAVRRETL